MSGNKSGGASKPSDEINRIIIGLGGQGSRVVNAVRNAVDSNGGLPNGLEFIAIDSDRAALASLDSVPEDQRVHVAAPDDSITETVVPWLPHEFRPKAGGGCGMQRLTGKGMYMIHRHKILEVVRETARRLRQRTQVSNFMVVLVNAFGGGTGSGMAIDFSLDLRGDIKEVTGQEPVMFGMGILPSRSETIQRANGAAMLKELHFLLSKKEPVVVNGRDYSSPFELYFLVGREAMGIERDDELLDGIVRFTLDLGLIPSTNRDTGGTGKGAGWVDLQDIRTLVKGAGHMFSTFGCYRAAFPVDTLHEYFQALDELEDLRERMPEFTTDVDARRQRLEDAKAELEHAEELLRRARARAARLRSDGIMGANRESLAQFLGDVARKEDDVRRLRREVGEAEEALPGLADERAQVEERLRDAEVRLERLTTLLTAPTQSQSQFTIPLSEEECAFLAENRHLVQDGDFRSVMDALDRLPEYYEKTMEVVGKSKILHMPLLNYRMSFHTAAAFPPRVLTALRKHGFARFDKAGNPLVNDDQLWMIMAMLSSNPGNVEADKVSGRAFKELAEGHVARRAEVKIVPSPSKRFEVVVHAWLVGLQVSPVAPGYPPRLRELEWLMPEYEQVAREGGLAQHHAFLYGDPSAFKQLTSVALERSDMTRAMEAVTDFWSGYAPVDAPSRWLQLPPVLAEAMVAAEDVGGAAARVAHAADAFSGSDAGLGAVERLSTSLEEGMETVEGFRRYYAEDANALRDRLTAITTQLERERDGPRDTDEIVRLEEIAAEAADACEEAASQVASLRAGLPEGVARALADGSASHGDPDRSRRALVRWEHAAAQAESRADQMNDVAGEVRDHLRELAGVLETLQDTLRARSLARVTGNRGSGVLGARKAPARVTARVDGGSNGNGNGSHTPARGGTRDHESSSQEDTQ